MIEPVVTQDMLSKVQMYVGKEIGKNFRRFRMNGSNSTYLFIVSNPQIAVKKKIQYFFLNKRFMDVPPIIKKTIINSFKDFTYPPCFVLAIEMQKGYDINVSADKMSSYIEDEKMMAEELHEFLIPISEEIAQFCNFPDPTPIFLQKDEDADMKRKREIDDQPDIYYKMMKLSSDPLEKSKNLSAHNQTQIKFEHIRSEPPIEPPISTTIPIKNEEPLIQRKSFNAISFQFSQFQTSSAPKELPQSTTFNDSSSKEIKPQAIITKVALNWKLENINKQYCNNSLELNPQAINSNSASNNISIELALNFKKTDFTNLAIIGQFNKGFIIAQKNQNFFIIDQHAADEKYLFETLQETTEIHRQPIIIPKALNLSPEDEMLMESYLEAFSLNGFCFKFSPENPAGMKYYISSFPLSKLTVFNENDFFEMLENLKNVGCVNDIFEVSKLIRPKKYKDMFASRACRKAVMIGTKIDNKKMSDILNNLSKIEHPWNCPHGRPTIRLLRSIPPTIIRFPKPFETNS